jgi:hypothetical protein
VCSKCSISHTIKHLISSGNVIGIQTKAGLLHPLLLDFLEACLRCQPLLLHLLGIEAMKLWVVLEEGSSPDTVTDVGLLTQIYDWRLLVRRQELAGSRLVLTGMRTLSALGECDSVVDEPCSMTVLVVTVVPNCTL